MNLFSNHQWAVTKSSVTTVKPHSKYDFHIKRLTETTDRHNGIFYDWPLHLAEKNWVNLDAFVEAFTKALELHRGKYKPALDKDMLQRSIEEAHRLRKSRFA